MTQDGKATAVQNEDPEFYSVFKTIVEIATITVLEYEKQEFNPSMRQRAIQAMLHSQEESPKEMRGFV